MRAEFAVFVCAGLVLVGCSARSTAAPTAKDQHSSENRPAVRNEKNLVDGVAVRMNGPPVQNVTIPTSPWTAVQTKECPKSVSVSTTYSVSCTACTDGLVYCWGDMSTEVLNAEGERRIGFYGARQIAGVDDAIDVSTNSLIACVLRRGGKVSCWGSWKQVRDWPDRE